MKNVAVSISASVSSLALTGLVVLAANPHPGGARDLCSFMIRNPYLRSERETYVIGSARSDSVQVRISDRPGVLPRDRYPYRDSTPVFGQVLRVRSVYGANGDRILTRMAAGDSTVVLIRYSFNSMCHTFPVRAWLDTGIVYHFTMLLRPDSEWTAGRPTFDSEVWPLLAVYPPYPTRMRRPDFDTLLTVDEYASLVKVLPIRADPAQYCPKALASIAAWAHSHEPRSELYPANEIIRVMQWNCGVRREP